MDGQTSAMRSKHGDWHIALQNMTEDKAEQIIDSYDVKYSSWFDAVNADAQLGYYISGKTAVLYGVEEAYTADIMDYPLEGSLPRTEKEVAVSADAKELLSVQPGAEVYERYDASRRGKGYALDFLLREIKLCSHGRFDGYIVLDADNVLDRDFILHMNETFSAGHDIVTCYRSSKNYGDNWISAGYALWFLRESRYLNGARSRLGSGCGVSGTGFLFSQTVLDAQGGGWPFHLLTEDIEFAINNVTLGMKVGSLYAIVVGPTTLKVPQPAMTFADFSIVWFIIGAAAVLALSAFKYRAAQRKVLSAQ